MSGCSQAIMQRRSYRRYARAAMPPARPTACLPVDWLKGVNVSSESFLPQLAWPSGRLSARNKKGSGRSLAFGQGSLCSPSSRCKLGRCWPACLRIVLKDSPPNAIASSIGVSCVVMRMYPPKDRPTPLARPAKSPHLTARSLDTARCTRTSFDTQVLPSADCVLLRS